MPVGLIYLAKIAAGGFCMGGSGGSSSIRPTKGTTRDVGDANDGGFGIDGSGGTSRCKSISEELRVQSPNPSILATVEKDDILTVSASNGKAPIILLDNSANTVGSILPSSGASLLKCINEGYTYRALVLSKTKGICVVRLYSE